MIDRACLTLIFSNNVSCFTVAVQFLDQENQVAVIFLLPGGLRLKLLFAAVKQVIVTRQVSPRLYPRTNHSRTPSFRMVTRSSGHGGKWTPARAPFVNLDHRHCTGVLDDYHRTQRVISVSFNYQSSRSNIQGRKPEPTQLVRRGHLIPYLERNSFRFEGQRCFGYRLHSVCVEHPSFQQTERSQPCHCRG